MFSGLAPTSRFSTILPLTIVLFASAVKDAYEDWKHRYSDHIVNNMTALVLRESGRFEEVRWADITPGSIVRLRKDESIPADILLLSTSEPGAQCFVSTSSLDGETNLKIKCARNETDKLIRSEEQAAQFEGSFVQTEPPNKNLYHFTGNLTLSHSQ